MLNDEENEAIIDFEREVEDGRLLKSDIILSLDTGLIIKNLLKKQQKEIEELSDKLTQKICKGVEEEILEEYRQTIISKDKEIEELKEDNKKYIDLHYVPYEQYTSKLNELNKKWKDKIKAKIEEKKDGTFDAKIVLQSLLEKE